MLLFKADAENSHKIAHLLDVYGAASGQLVNLAKSALYFSTNTLHDNRTIAMRNLDITRLMGDEIYLGW